MAMRDAAQRRDRHNKAAATGCVMVLFTIVAAPILAVCALDLSHDRANTDAYNAAPVCTTTSTATSTNTVACKQEAGYQVVSKDQQGGGHDASYYLNLATASGAQTRVQLTSATGMWNAALGERVTVTSWHGAAVSVSDGRSTSRLADSPIQSGDAPYSVLAATAAVYVYLVLLALRPRAAGPLLLAPTAIVVLGIALHGRIIGGPWKQDFLLWIFGALALAFVVQLLPVPRLRRAQR